MSVRPLSAQAAMVKTAAIEIKTIIINSKQLTLSAFRQIPRKQILDENGLKLEGIPWGWVNYHPDQCLAEPEHLHVIWQVGTSLYRDSVRRTSDTSPFNDELTRAANKCGQIWLIKDYQQVSPFTHVEWRSMANWIRSMDSTEYGNVRDKLNGLFDSWLIRENGKRYIKAEGVKVEIDFPYQVLGDQLSIIALNPNLLEQEKEAVEQLTTLCEKYKEWQESRSNIYKALMALDQLYIAL